MIPPYSKILRDMATPFLALPITALIVAHP